VSFKVSLLAALLGLVPLHGESGRRPPLRATEGQGPVHIAAPGDVASGRVLSEKNKELDLDTSPCSSDRVVRFHDPYERNVIGTLKCGNSTYDRVQVRQK
jgi:hypothetical protein